MKRSFAGLTALVIALLLPTASSADGRPGSQPDHQGSITAAARIAWAGETSAIGRLDGDIHAPVTSADVPGGFSFEGESGADFAAARSITERVSFWYDPNHPFAGSGGSNVGLAEGHTCLYYESQAPVCLDTDVVFIDVLNPGIADQLRYCTWIDETRPAPVEGIDPCDPSQTPTAVVSEFEVLSGTITVRVVQ